MMEYDLSPQQVQRAYEELSMRLRNPEVKNQVLANLIKDGFLTDDDWKLANKTAMAFFIVEKQTEIKVFKEAEQTRIEANKIDSLLPRLWPHKTHKATR